MSEVSLLNQMLVDDVKSLGLFSRSFLSEKLTWSTRKLLKTSFEMIDIDNCLKIENIEWFFRLVFIQET